MGTNYYAIINECPSCKRHDRLHVGKSGGIVQGFRDTDDEGRSFARTGDGEGGTVLLPFPILGLAEWEKYLRSVPHRIVNEYGDAMTDDELFTGFRSCSAEVRRRQYLYTVEHPYRDSHKTNWLDDEGFSVSGAWFS